MHFKISKKLIVTAIVAVIAAQAVVLGLFVAPGISAETVAESSREGIGTENASRQSELLAPYTEIKKLFEETGDEADASMAESYSRKLCASFSGSIITRESFIAMAMDALGETPERLAEDESLWELQYIFNLTEADPYLPLTRGFVANFLTLRFGYGPHSYDCADRDSISVYDSNIFTALYYRYLETDENGNAAPDERITPEELERILDELRLYAVLHGKHILTFGDSIMYGEGNGGEGIGDLAAEKYGMTVTDYAVSGATVSISEKHSIIPDQIFASAKKKDAADIILIDGVTNDVERFPIGAVMPDKALSSFDRSTFAGGLEYSFALLKKYWPDTPVLYIRPHDMAIRDDAEEQKYGELALKICDKWEIPYVDLYSDTSFNTEIQELSDRYTKFNIIMQKHDSVHPNREGYMIYYMPLISEKMAELLGGQPR